MRPSEVAYQLVEEDCFAWMDHCSANSVHAIVTDPPYGLKEYTAQEKDKLRRGRGGVWRVPPLWTAASASPCLGSPSSATATSSSLPRSLGNGASEP